MFIDLYKCSVMADALEMKQAYTSITKKCSVFRSTERESSFLLNCLPSVIKPGTIIITIMWLQIRIINLVVC